MRAVDALMECLKAEGVDVVFGLPGGANLPTYDAFVDGGIRHILVRHEQGAGHAAEGYAQVTGRPGVAMVTSGPGATNIVTPLADAYMDSIPLVVITGQVASGAIGSIGAQPVMDAAGHGIDPGGPDMLKACVDQAKLSTLVCSDEPLAHVLREIGWSKTSRLIGLAAFLALPSVILMMMFGQTRVFFSMARDRLLPDVLTKIHPRFHTPHVVTLITGTVVMCAAAFFPVGNLADTSNGGTLAAFFSVALGVMILRRTAKDRKRPFRTPAIWLVGPLALIGCLALFLLLSFFAKMVFFGWAALGLVFYAVYGRRRSTLHPDYVEPLDPK